MSERYRVWFVKSPIDAPFVEGIVGTGNEKVVHLEDSQGNIIYLIPLKNIALISKVL